MRPVLGCEEITKLEAAIERAGTSLAELMELAGEFVADEAAKFDPKHVVVLVGFGNNGGDGWVAADILAQKGMDVDVVAPCEPDEIPSQLARHVARRTAGRDVSIIIGPSKDELSELIATADLVIDGMLGTGSHGSLRAPFTFWVSALNESGVPVLAIDIPSGLDPQTGAVENDCVRADRTVTMLAPKIGLFSGEGPDTTGEVLVGELYDHLDEYIDDVEHEAEIVDPEDIVDFLEPLPSNINKYSRGSVLVVAGSAQYPGAAIMAAKAAARAGAGYVAVATPSVCANLIRMALPSVPVFSMPSDARGGFGAAATASIRELAERYSCVLCGPGMTAAGESMDVVGALLATNVPLVLDADALNAMARVSVDSIDATPELYRREAPLILTPHHKELSRLVGGTEVHDLSQAIDAAQRIVWAAGSDNMAVVAKGPTTAIVGVEKVLLPLAGPASLATAGSGDVLAGIIAGSLALNRDIDLPIELLCAYAVAIHSYTGFAAAAKYGEKSVMATDLIDLIGDAMQLAADAIVQRLNDEADDAQTSGSKPSSGKKYA